MMINNFHEKSSIDCQRHLCNHHRLINTDINKDLKATISMRKIEVRRSFLDMRITIPSSITFRKIKFKMLRKSNAALVFVLLLFLTFVNSSPSFAQCAMCSINAEQGAKNGNTITQGINTGVLILLGTVYFLMIGLGILWYKKFRKRSMKEVNNLFPANQVTTKDWIY